MDHGETEVVPTEGVQKVGDQSLQISRSLQGSRIAAENAAQILRAVGDLKDANLSVFSLFLHVCAELCEGVKMGRCVSGGGGGVRESE